MIRNEGASVNKEKSVRRPKVSEEKKTRTKARRDQKADSLFQKVARSKKVGGRRGRNTWEEMTYSRAEDYIEGGKGLRRRAHRPHNKKLTLKRG